MLALRLQDLGPLSAHIPRLDLLDLRLQVVDLVLLGGHLPVEHEIHGPERHDQDDQAQKGEGQALLA
jgi:hypothetical protein